MHAQVCESTCSKCANSPIVAYNAKKKLVWDHITEVDLLYLTTSLLSCDNLELPSLLFSNAIESPS